MMMIFWGAVFALLLTNGLCERKQDFSYKMKAGRFYSRHISYGGPTLIIGSFPEITLKDTNSNTEMDCTINVRRNDYRDFYRTQAFFRDESGFRTAKMNSTMFAEYFVFRKKELWTCRSSETVGLIRLVNEIIGSKEILKVVFPDGVEVFPKSLMPGKRTVILREIKYLDLYGVPVRYDGWFNFKEIQVEKNFFIPDLRETLKEFDRLKKGGGFIETQYKSDPDKFEAITSADSSLTVGDANIATEIDSDELNCKKYQGANPFPFNLRPKCEVKINKQPIAITKDNYFHYFTPIRDELWVCEGQNQLQVLRLVNDFVTRFEVGEATVYSEVTELRKITLWKKYGMRIKTVRYYNHSSYDKPMTKYQGVVKLIGAEEGELKVLPNYAEQTGSEIKDFDYHLHTKCVFKTMVSSRGLSIKLGMHFKKEVGTKNDKFKCTMQPSEPYMPDYGTRFRLSLRMGDKHFLKAIPRSKHADYWDFIKQEVWLCESTTTDDKFLRIVNELKGLVELFEVEYHDGIQLYIRALYGDSKSVNVIEIKYIDPITFDPLQYLGTLTLEDPPASTMHEFIKCFNCDGQPIQRTEDEIYFGVNARKDKFAVEYRQRGVLYRLTKKDGVWCVKGADPAATAVIIVGAVPDKISGKIVDVVECVESDATNSAFPALVRDVRIENGVVHLDERSSEQNEALKIKFLTSEVWLCQNSELKFYRVKNTLTVGAPVKLLYFLDGTSHIKYTDKIDLEEFKYIDAEDFKYVKYEGDIIIYPKLDGFPVISGTVTMGKEYAPAYLPKEHSDGQEVIYSLDYERIHKFDIAKQFKLLDRGKSGLVDKRTIISFGTNLEKKSDDFDTADLIVNCRRRQLVDEIAFKAKYLPQIEVRSERRPGDSGVHNPSAIDKSMVLEKLSFKLFNYQVWDCKTDDQKYSFERVVNKLSYHVTEDKVDEIWYHDGFSVESGLANFKDTFHFVEIRYMKNSATIRYDGKIIIRNDQQSSTTPEPDDESTLMSQAILDINYELPSKYVYKKEISAKGAILKIGSQYEERYDFGAAFGDDNILTCYTASAPVGINTDMIVEIGTQYQSLFRYTKISQKEKDALFKTPEKKYWSCVDKNGDRELIRVVNKWVTVNKGAISEVIYYDGVTLPLDGSSIREVKFMTTAGKVVRYDGFVSFDSTETNHLLTPSGGGDREFTYDLNSKLVHFRNLNPEVGPVVEVGSHWQQVHTANSDVKCYISQKEKVEFKDAYKMRVLTTRKQAENEYVKAELSLQELKDTFKVIRNEAYECKPTGSTDVAFIKVVNKLETKVDISSIFHTDGITIWRSQTVSGAVYIREVKFIDNNDPNIVLKYEGKVQNKFEKKSCRFDEGSSVEEERAPLDGAVEDQRQAWYKDHRKWESNGRVGNEPLENIRYLPGTKSKIVQPFSGYNMEVGSRWLKEMGERRDTYICVKDTATHGKDVESLLLPKVIVLQDYDEYELDKDTILDYFRIVSQEVLKCTNANGPQSFIRVRTELVGRWGVRRVYYFDGVRVFSHELGTSTNTVRLVELKYLDPSAEYKVVKYEGKVEMKQ